MKKLALAVIATAFIAISHSPVSAQTEDPNNPVPPELAVECGESVGRQDGDLDGIDDRCVNFYLTVAQAPPVIPQVPPAAAPPVVAPEAGLPRTGSSVSPLLSLAAALAVGGGIIVVATRRRSTATAS